MFAIDKLRIILNWADYQNESTDEQFKSIKGIELAYDYCKANNLEFLDDEYLNGLLLSDEINGTEFRTHIKNRRKFFNQK